MCDPVTIGLMATSALSMASQQIGANARADSLEEANNLYAKQQSQQAGARISDRVKAGRRERGRLRAAAAESGLQAGSRALQLQEMNSFFQENLDEARLVQNAEANIEGANQRMEAQVAGSGVSGLQVAAGLGGAYLQGTALAASSGLPDLGTGLQIPSADSLTTLDLNSVGQTPLGFGSTFS